MASWIIRTQCSSTAAVSSFKPFYKIFIEVTADQMGLDLPGVVQKTGLTDRQVRTIITRQMKVAPLDLALQLSDTLNVPLEVWLGIENYTPAEVSTDAYEVARAYDRAKRQQRTPTSITSHRIPIPPTPSLWKSPYWKPKKRLLTCSVPLKHASSMKAPRNA